jgi:hypothetical protein
VLRLERVDEHDEIVHVVRAARIVRAEHQDGELRVAERGDDGIDLKVAGVVGAGHDLPSRRWIRGNRHRRSIVTTAKHEFRRGETARGAHPTSRRRVRAREVPAILAAYVGIAGAP